MRWCAEGWLVAPDGGHLLAQVVRLAKVAELAHEALGHEDLSSGVAVRWRDTGEQTGRRGSLMSSHIRRLDVAVHNGRSH
jgi:hypothetical protein